MPVGVAVVLGLGVTLGVAVAVGVAVAGCSCCSWARASCCSRRHSRCWSRARCSRWSAGGCWGRRSTGLRNKVLAQSLKAYSFYIAQSDCPHVTGCNRGRRQERACYFRTWNTLQLLPLQRPIKAKLPPSPTAHASVAEAAATPYATLSGSTGFFDHEERSATLGTVMVGIG